MVQVSQRFGNVLVRGESLVTVGSEKHALPTRCQAMRGHHLRGLQRRKQQQQQQRKQKSFRTTKNANPKVSLFFEKSEDLERALQHGSKTTKNASQC